MSGASTAAVGDADAAVWAFHGWFICQLSDSTRRETPEP